MPNSVGTVEKLRVLSIIWSVSLRQLPSSESFERLYNLRTITLRHCCSLKHLLHSITLLSNLENIDLGYCFELVELPEDMGNLKMLEV
uniref:Uncharacterized protein n=1 Tax=Arundo donax TaxID=35708 RepID=A0A0A8Z415_ARUDO